MKLPIPSLLVAAWFAAMISAATAQVVHDAAADFSITNGNPNGVWSYGHMPSPGGTFTPCASGAS